ncbi:MAG: DEAD/DEAH box helicase family protein, partial [Acidobacteria bacterium]|nr:DEAD/DEAH box helicase family protein [Acidobacteriota bacterium]
MTLHPLQRRYHAEDLVRLRRSDESRRYAAPQRAGHVDPNPHQIEAVIFALSRLGEGGCILADEVGLGKTIEAGLVVAQLRAEGAQRILLVVPKPLLGQWRQELFTLFGIEARDEWPAPGAFDGTGVFLVGREAAGSERGQQAILAGGAFDLIVIDEAHEVFAGLHRRFDASGDMRDDAPAAHTAGRLFEVVRQTSTPVLLLTATPIQNNLKELWALVRFVDPAGTLLGDISTFRRTFCDGDERAVVEGQSHELRRRIQVVLKRTLRRQAQEFLSRPFVDRQARLFEYPMTVDERSLYEDVTRYLLEPNLAAFQGNQRRLLLIGFHRLMASSTAALASSLRKVAARLRRLLEGGKVDDAPQSFGLRELAADLEDDDLLEPSEDPADLVGAVSDSKSVEAELARVEGFIARAVAQRDDGKS